MNNPPATPADAFNVRHRFLNRKKLYCSRDQVANLANQIRVLLNARNTEDLRNLLDDYYPPDLADVMTLLNEAEDKTIFDLLGNAEAADVLDELDDRIKEDLVRLTPPDRLARIIEALPIDEGADILRCLPPAGIERTLSSVNPPEVENLRYLLSFPKESAGGIMSLGFVAVLETATVAEALKKFQETPFVESIFSIFVTDEPGALLGTVDLHELLEANPDQQVKDRMTSGFACTYTDIDQEEVARTFARYDLNSLPVLNRSQGDRLVGVITADDIIDVIEQETTQDIMRMTGSDAEEMERRSPARIALLRLPWIMATMFIELLAGFVIHFYDATLARVLLLTSFMPIISAISGNTGLQSATIIVRGLSTGSIQVTQWHRAVIRQLSMTLILGGATGITLGIIGAIWYGKWIFGLVIFLGMFAAVNIAGVVGTVVPLTSKRLGFDPAITSGPFETAFQDVVGISIFLTLATVMLRFLVR